MPTVILVRHGRSTANTSHVLAGWSSGVDLDEVGRAQAAEMGAAMADLPIDRWVASPLQRCQTTAQILRDAHHAQTPDLETQVNLGECRYGAWTGQPIKDLLEDPLWPVVQAAPSNATFPEDDEFEHESLTQMSARAVGAIRSYDALLRREIGPEAVWVAVSHGDPIKAIVADALGMHLDLFQRIVIDPGAACVITYAKSRPYLHRMNARPADIADFVVPRKPTHDATPGGSTGTGSEPGAAPPADSAGAEPEPDHTETNA